MSWIPFLFRIVAFTFWFSRAHGFAFVVSQPTQCGSQRFTWVGGTPPFYALAIPPDGTLRNFTVPASAWNAQNQTGDFATVLPLQQNQMVVFSMGDATGETTGGISNVMTVGAPTAGTQSCNLTDPGVQFYYATDSALQQCKNYPFSLFVQSGAVLPISILVTVPNGESFILHPPNNNDPFNWQANLTAGTPVLFTMTDAQNRVGGTSSLVTVQSSDDSSCVHPLPSSAAPTRVPSPTGSAPATNTGGSGGNNNNNNNSSNKTNHTGLIIGVAVGGAVALLILIALIYFVAKRNGAQFGTKVKRIDLTEPGPDSSTYLLPGHSQQNNYPPLMPFPPYRDTSTPSVNPFQPTDPNRLSTTTTFNNGLSAPVTSMDATVNISSVTAVPAGIYGAGAAAGVQAHQPSMGAKQREAMSAQQRNQQYQQQPQQSYFNPYETELPSSGASSSAYYPTTSSRQSAQPDSLSQSGVTSSNFSSAAGPSTVSSGQSSSNKRPTSNSTTIAPQRFIVHTDIEDEPIELPPMYSESRGPIPGIPASSTPQTGKGSTY